MCTERVKDKIKLDIGFAVKFVHTQKMLLSRQHHLYTFGASPLHLEIYRQLLMKSLTL